MKKSSLFLLLAVLCSFSDPQNTDEAIMHAAKDRLNYFLQKIPHGNEAAYGFTAKDNMQSVTVDKPFRTVTFTKEFYANTTSQNESIVLQDEWRVPVMLDGRYRALFTVNSSEQGYTANAIGAAALATELQGMMRKINETEHCYILRIYHLRMDSLCIWQVIHGLLLNLCRLHQQKWLYRNSERMVKLYTR